MGNSPRAAEGVQVVLAFMEVGIPLSKLDCTALRELLEKSQFLLTH